METIEEQIEEDERNCVSGSLAHDEKLSKEREAELRSKAMEGGCVHTQEIGRRNK